MNGTCCDSHNLGMSCLQGEVEQPLTALAFLKLEDRLAPHCHSSRLGGSIRYLVGSQGLAVHCGRLQPYSCELCLVNTVRLDLCYAEEDILNIYNLNCLGMLGC